MATSLPPGPRGSLRGLVAYLRDPIHCMVPFTHEYGDPFSLPGKPPVVFTGEPANIQAIYSADPDTFEPLGQDVGDLIGRRVLLLLSGSEHRRARKLMGPSFQGPRMRAYSDGMVAAARKHSDGWRVGQTVSLLETAQHISLDVIIQAIFGVSDPERMAQLATLLLDITNGINPLLALFPALRREFGGVGPFASFQRRRQRLWSVLDELIAARRASANPPQDVLGLLLQARDDDGQPLSDADLRDQLVLMTFAGHETTAIAISWAFHALHQRENAAVLERLRTELDAVGAGATPAELAGLPYLEAVVQETLRRYPLAPAPSPRRLLRPLNLGGYELPAGIGVAAGIGIVHFNEKVYPEPLRFRPERFLERQYSPFEFIPFGGGARRCLGASMATHEMKLVIVTLLRRFRLRLASTRVDPGAVRAANVGPKYGVKMVVEERRE
ncbi:MAG: cytochrome P450 [Myxococcota bacterium]